MINMIDNKKFLEITNSSKGIFLSPIEIVEIHNQIIDSSSVDDQKGFLDVTGAIFESSIMSVFAAFGDVDFFPSIEEKACQLCINLVKNHCFKNANKRTALKVFILTLQMNDIAFNYTNNQKFNIIVGISINKISYDDLLSIVRNNPSKELLSLINDEINKEKAK